VYGIDERYKAKCCGPDAKDWLEQLRILRDHGITPDASPCHRSATDRMTRAITRIERSRSLFLIQRHWVPAHAGTTGFSPRFRASA
jgi:hypothetical protein